MNNRRSDSGLRQAISNIEQALLVDDETEVVLMRCLQQLMVLLSSRFGFVMVCGEAVGGDIPWRLVGSYADENGGGLKPMKNYSTSECVPEDHRFMISKGRSFSGLSPLDALPHYHPDIQNFSSIPLIEGERPVAVMYLCNLATPFDEIVNRRIRPFVAAATSMLRSGQTSKHLKTRLAQMRSSPDTQRVMFEFLDSLFNGVLILDEHDRIVQSNQAATDLLASAMKGLNGHLLQEFVATDAPWLQGRLKEEVESAHSSQTLWRGFPLVAADGSRVLVNLKTFEINIADRLYRGVVLEDINLPSDSKAEYLGILQRFQVLTNLAPVGILQLDREWRCVYVNDTWCEYCQMTPQEANGLGWFRGVHDSDVGKVLPELRTQTSLNGRYDGEFRLCSPLGKITWVKANACCLYNQQGETSGMIMTFIDVTDHLENERRLRDIAERDQLTGLVNRTFFNDRLEVALASVDRYGPVALMFLDLDEFKHINDTLGHDAGDVLLCGVANRLKDSLRQADTIARIGGDEFTLIFTGLQSPTAITAVVEKMLRSLEDPFVLSHRSVYITCSIGVAIAEERGISTQLLLKQADIALYKAKKSGRNQYSFYTEELDAHAHMQIYLRQSLRENGRRDFRVVYQPQVDAETGRVVGMEALTRWVHPEVDAASPDVFIKMIEESGLMGEFFSWLLEDVMNTVSRWPGFMQTDIVVSINLSAKQLRDRKLPSVVQRCCMLNGIPPEKICLEVTETAFMDDSQQAADILGALRTMGFSIALDDFGTGFSALSYLRVMPLHTVKIDRSFVKDITEDEGDAKIVQSILMLAKNLGLSVVAEGVDSEEIVAWLLKHDCRCQQGFYFYKPIESGQAAALVARELASSTTMSAVSKNYIKGPDNTQ